MNIIYDHTMFTIQKFGGITRIFIELMRELSCYTGCAVHWHRGLYIDGYDISDFRKRLKRYWGFRKIPFFLQKITDTNFNKYSFDCFCRLNIGKYDIYHPTYYDSSLLKIPKAKKIAVTIHDMIPELYLASMGRFQKLIKDKQRIVRKADIIFVNSISTKNDLEEILKVESDKIHITPWATNINKFNIIDLPANCCNKPYFLYVGTRSKYKNFDVLMQAFADNDWLKKNFNIVCFGGTGNFLEPETDYFKKNNIINNFIYLAGNDALLKSLYINAQALIYTSRYEGFGLPLLEAMECGCPVTCCNSSAIPEVVGNNALFFDPDSPDELFESMKKIVEDTVERNLMILKGFELAKQFSWEKTAKLTFNGYRSII